MQITIMRSLSEGGGFLNKNLPSVPSPFPQLDLRLLVAQYDQYLKRLTAQITQARTDPDWKKELTEDRDAILDRRATVQQMIALNSLKTHDGVDKPLDILHFDRAKAVAMYAEFVHQYPKG